jgi:hypothetical protein
MRKRQETIREPTVRELIEANSIRSAYAVGQKGGFAVAFRYGLTERFLSSTRGEVRLFSNLTTLAAYLRRLGISRFEVDTANYEAGRLRPARPDRAEALRNTRTRLSQADLLETPAP